MLNIYIIKSFIFKYCDVHVPKIQEMLDKIPTPLSGATCNEKTGWLPPNFDDNCREILTETIDELLELQPADFDPNALATASRSVNETSQQEITEWEYEVRLQKLWNFQVGRKRYDMFVFFSTCRKMMMNLHRVTERKNLLNPFIII